MTTSSAALLLAAIALMVAAYVVACDHFDSVPHDGPWSIGAVLLAGLSLAPHLVDAHVSRYPAQDKGPCVQAALVAASADSHLDARQRGGGSLPGREPRVRWAGPGHCAPREVIGVPGPVSIMDQSRPVTVARREGVATAQDKGSCLPWLGSRVAAGRTKGARGNDAPPLSSGPAGVPGGHGSRGSAPFHAATANGGSPQGPWATIAGRHLGRGGSVERRA